MDISGILPSEQTLEILNPSDDKKLGIRVSLMSPDDPRMKPIKRKITDFNLQKQKRGKTLKAVEIDKNENELIAAAITGWEWYGEDVTFEGEIPDFNPRNVIRVFTKLNWFKQQISDELDDEKGFFSN